MNPYPIIRKEIEKYRSLNDSWRRYNIPKAIISLQEINYAFFSPIDPKSKLREIETEMILTYDLSTFKIVLRELGQEIDKNIYLYEKNKSKIFENDFEALANDRIIALGINWFEKINDYSLNIKKLIKKYIGEIEINKSGANLDPNSNAELSSIFTKPEYYELCLKLFKEVGIVDNSGKCLLTKGKGYFLFAVIDSIKSHTKHELLINLYNTDRILLPFFNSHLKTSYAQLKRNSMGFEDVRKQAKLFIYNSLEK